MYGTAGSDNTKKGLRCQDDQTHNYTDDGQHDKFAGLFFLESLIAKAQNISFQY